MSDIRAVGSKWGPIALVCKKCGKKLGGGFGRKGKRGLAEEMGAVLKESGRRRALRVVEVGCLGVCPKGAVAVAMDERVVLVPEGAAVEAVIGVLVG